VTRGASSRTYRGADRRSETLSGRSKVLFEDVVRDAIVIIGGLAIPIGFTIGRTPGPAAVLALLPILSGVMAVGIGLAELIHWRVVGHGFSAWFGVAFTSFGVLTLLAGTTPSSDLELGSGSPAATPIIVVSSAALFCWLAWKALQGPQVDAKVAPVTMLAATAAGAVGTFELLELASARGVLGPAASSLELVLAEALAAGGWLTVAIWARHLQRGGTVLPTWLVPFFLMLSLSHVVRCTAPLDDSVGLVAEGLEMAALALGLAGALLELLSALRGQDRQSHRLRLGLDELRHQVETERSSLDDRLHDLRNAVAAIRSADSALRRYAGTLDEHSRVLLAEGISAELERLQSLIEPNGRLVLDDVYLAEVVLPVVTLERGLGRVISMDLGDLRVHGDREGLAQVVQNLLVNARRYAPDASVAISASVRKDMVELRIADDGPGIAAFEREAIFQRGVRGSAAVGTIGDGLGLDVARRLTSAMGGTLKLDEEAAIGACFIVAVPVAQRADGASLSADAQTLRSVS
jgi:signal transduction histidine kinase